MFFRKLKARVTTLETSLEHFARNLGALLRRVEKLESQMGRVLSEQRAHHTRLKVLEAQHKDSDGEGQR